MFPSTIPSEYDARLLVWSNEGLSHRDIAARLVKAGVPASHMAVGRRRRTMRRGASPLRKLEAEVWTNLAINLEDLEETEMRLRAIEEIAFKGDRSKGIKPDIKIALRTVTRRGELILNKHRFLQAVITQRKARREAGDLAELSATTSAAQAAGNAPGTPDSRGATAETAFRAGLETSGTLHGTLGGPVTPVSWPVG